MGGKVSAKKKQKQNLNITKGLPLPNNGACEHYKKSFRCKSFIKFIINNQGFVFHVVIVFIHVMNVMTLIKIIHLSMLIE